MATLTVYPSTDITLASSSSTWSTAVAGGGALSADAEADTFHEIGASFFTPTYYISETFLGFDTSALPDDCTIDDAVLSIYGKQDSSTTDFTIECGAYDYGASITTADWQDGTETGALTVVATRSSAGFSIAGYNDFTNTGGGLKSIVSKTGITKIALWPERVRTGVAPANGQFVQFWSAEEDQSGERRPSLTITYTPAAVATVRRGLLLGVG